MLVQGILAAIGKVSNQNGIITADIRKFLKQTLQGFVRLHTPAYGPRRVHDPVKSGQCQDVRRKRRHIGIFRSQNGRNAKRLWECYVNIIASHAYA